LQYYDISAKVQLQLFEKPFFGWLASLRDNQLHLIEAPVLQPPMQIDDATKDSTSKSWSKLWHKASFQKTMMMISRVQ
jgi:hypothetical protein